MQSSDKCNVHVIESREPIRQATLMVTHLLIDSRGNLTVSAAGLNK